ncbi:hypothetical protein L210DRAFT_943610, partial [Boletus edulis BED1]
MTYYSNSRSRSSKESSDLLFGAYHLTICLLAQVPLAIHSVVGLRTLTPSQVLGLLSGVYQITEPQF